MLPGSKSVANRLLVAAALCGSEVVITGVTASDDVRHLVNGLRTLGFAIAFGDVAERVVVGPRVANPPTHGELFCGNAGTALRFLVSVAAITPGDWTITGDEAMQRRPIGPLVAAWRQLGVEMTDTNGCPPVRVRGRADVRRGDVELDATLSSQFASSLLLVAAKLSEGLRLLLSGAVASAEYIALTANALRRCGVRIDAGTDCARVWPGYGVSPREVTVSGDWSSAGVWTCLNHLTGSRVRAGNLEIEGQPDERLLPALRALPATGEHTIDVGTLPDQFMNLAIVAAHRAGTTRLTGGTNLRIKETDRVAVMARELTKLGANVDELPDGLVVRGGRPLRAGTIDPAMDHRIAMSFALAGLLSPGITIADPGCVTKSYPRFWQDLELVLAQRRCIAVIGMRGAGKSTFARAFAAATGVDAVDSDAQFTMEHGAIGPFVARRGWSAFREHEEHIVANALRAGHVVSTGGGAIESANTRRLLRERALVVWLDAGADLLRSRLLAAPEERPSITGAPVADEIPELLARRQPHYAAVAHVRIDAALPVEAQVDQARRELGTSCRWPGASAPH